MADVVANGGVRAAAGLHRGNTLGRQRVMARQELGVFPGEDVVRHDRNLAAIAKQPAQHQEQRGLAAANRSTDANGEGPACEVAGERRRAIAKRARTGGTMSVWVIRIVVEAWKGHG